jgi:sugar phosphate isomerase/epimerase
VRFGLCDASFSDAHTRAGMSPDPWTIEGLLRLTVDNGLQAVEFPPGWVENLTHEERERLSAELDLGGLSVVLDTGGATEPDEIGRAVESALTTASTVGAAAVRTTISRCLEGDRGRYGLDGWKTHLRALVAPFRKAVSVAAEVGIPFGVENHQDITSAELVWMCEQVDSPYFGVIMDSGNALAVGEEPGAFADRVMPYLKHVQLKDYVAHPTPSGWRLVRCALGAGVVDFPDLIGRVDAGAPGVIGCIELGATTARHIRLLEDGWWSTFDPRPWTESLAAIRVLHAGEQPRGLDWRTPHERDEPPEAAVAYELDEFEASVAYLRGTFGWPAPTGPR